MRRILIFSWLFLLLVHVSAWGRESIKVMITGKGAFDLAYTDDSFKPFFKEPFEILVVVLNDGRCLIFSESDSRKVGISEHQLNNSLKKMGYGMEDVGIIVHNHLKPLGVAPQDKKFCHRLVRFGFQGKFLVYLQGRNKTKEYHYKKPKKHSKSLKLSPQL